MTLGTYLRWNQTGVLVAGGTMGSAANQFNDPCCIYIDANDTLYICDHHNYRIQKWKNGATIGETVVDTGSDHPEALTFDKNGFMYVTGHNKQRVLRYPPNSDNGTNVAGQFGVASTAFNNFNNPLGMAVDDNLNLYVAERDNQRVMRWPLNALIGTAVIPNTAASSKFYGLLLSPDSSDKVYVSSEEKDSVYLWTLFAPSASGTYTQVNSSTGNLNKPRGLSLDPYGNLYVADKDNKRVVMYCVNSTMGKVVAGGTGSTPTLQKPDDVALDSNLNLYVVDEGAQSVYRYKRI